MPTVENFKLRYKSFRGFLQHWGIKIACFQVRIYVVRMQRRQTCCA